MAGKWDKETDDEIERRMFADVEEDDEERRRREEERRRRTERRTHLRPLGDSYALLGAMENITLWLLQEHQIIGQLDEREMDLAESNISQTLLYEDLQEEEIFRGIYNPMWVEPNSVFERKPFIFLENPRLRATRDTAKEGLFLPKVFKKIRSIYFQDFRRGSIVVVYPIYHWQESIEIGHPRPVTIGSGHMLTILLKQSSYSQVTLGQRLRKWQEIPFMAIRFVYCPQYRIKDPTNPLVRRPQLDVQIFYTYSSEKEVEDLIEVTVPANIFEFSDSLLECVVNFLPQPEESIRDLSRSGWTLPDFNSGILAEDLRRIGGTPTRRLETEMGIAVRKLHLICESQQCPYCTGDVKGCTVHTPEIGVWKKPRCPHCARELIWRCPYCAYLIPEQVKQCPACQRLIYDWESQKFMNEAMQLGSRYGKFKRRPYTERRVREIERERVRFKGGSN